MFWGTAAHVSGGAVATYHRQIGQHRATSKARSAHFAPEAEWLRVVARDKKFSPRFERAMKSIFNAQRKEAIRRLNAIPAADRSLARAVTVSDLFDPEAWDDLFKVRVNPIRRSAAVNSRSYS